MNKLWILDLEGKRWVVEGSGKSRGSLCFVWGELEDWIIGLGD